jgi:tRNA(Ile)-lysidine synthase
MTRKRQPYPDWPSKAVRVGELLPRARFHPAVLAWAERRRKTEPWCVAFSGGADSLALLLLLRAHWPERRLIALHFNHRLRGRAADADAKFCARTVAALGLECVVGVWRGARNDASEAEAREARHVFFAREMKKLGARALWLAHQQDDIAETMLMRLARGSGTGGLAAPRPVQPQADGRVHLRLLLTLKKTEIVAALRAVGAHWREDATNAGTDFLRNRVRRAVLPAWAKAAGARDALAGAALARERLEEDDAALEAWLDRLAPLKRGRLDLRRLGDAPRALWRRALHRWLLRVEPETDLSRSGFERLLAAVETGRDTRFSLGAGGFAVVRRSELSFRRKA